MVRVWTPGVEAQMLMRNYGLATAWRITRADTTKLLFTDHDREVVVTGETYTPLNAPSSSSAAAFSSNLEVSNKNIAGFLSSDAITDADMYAGRYLDAEVLVSTFNWRFPWLGTVTLERFWIVQTTFTGEVWEVELEGIEGRLRSQTGLLASRKCAWDLGGAYGTDNIGCHADIEPMSELNVTINTTGYEIEISNFRRTFRIPTLHDTPGWFNNGRVEYLTGPNVGLTNRVRKFYTGILGSQLCDLWIDEPFDIGTPRANVWVGCNKLSGVTDSTGHCVNKFDTLIDFAGDPYLPGPDETIRKRA